MGKAREGSRLVPAAIAAVGGALALIHLIRKLRTLQQLCDALTERVRLHDTAIEYLTMRLEAK
eukprot:6197032-Pleurochrysis_carterae.AAC.1